MNAPGFPTLLECAEARYSEWYEKKIRPKQDRRMSELKRNLTKSVSQRAFGTIDIYGTLLKRAVRKRIGFYAEEASKPGGSEMLSDRRLEEYRSLLLRPVQTPDGPLLIEVLALKEIVEQQYRAAGSFVESNFPSRTRYLQLQNEITSIVHSMLRRLTADGERAPNAEESSDSNLAGANERSQFDEFTAYANLLKQEQNKFRTAHPLIPSGWLPDDSAIADEIPLNLLPGIVRYRERQAKIADVEKAVRDARGEGAALNSGVTSPRPAGPLMANNQGQKRGPKTDYQTANQVAGIVNRIAPDGNWRARLDDICEALDEAGVRQPKTWRKKRDYRAWSAANAGEPRLVVQAIGHHLKNDKRRPTEILG